MRLFAREFTTFSARLNARFVDEYSLAESRVLFAFKSGPQVAVSDLRAELGIDAGYLSRILTSFEHDGLVERTTRDSDRRRQYITITEAGLAALAVLDRRATELGRELLACLTPEQQDALGYHLASVRELLSDDNVQRWLARGPRRDH